MVSALAREDYEDLIAAGLPATLEDFDRLNCLALRLTDGPNTTAANFPRIGWAGDIPFHRPTCQALSWYLEYCDRAPFSAELRDFCWFYALHHGREAGAFERLTMPRDIRSAVEKWIASLPVTAEEIARACRYAVTGFDDATPGKTQQAADADAAKGEDERREESIANLNDRVTECAAATGIAPEALVRETPSRLEQLTMSALKLNGREFEGGEAKRRAEYDLALREIRRRLKAEKESADNG